MHQPCPWCHSSDAYSEFEENNEYVKFCFSCRNRESKNMNDVSPEELVIEETQTVHKQRPIIPQTDLDPIIGDYRCLLPKTLEHFGVKRHRNEIVYPYYQYNDRTLIAQKFKFKNPKSSGNLYAWANYHLDSIGFFGQHLFPKGGRKITVTEGENDCMAVFQMQGDWPVVSIKNGAGSVKGLSQRDHEYLNSFDEIVVCFDNDKSGRKAIEDFCTIFAGKCRVVELPSGYKDAHQMLENGLKDKFRQCWFNAKPWSPKNIVYPIDILDEIVTPKEYEILPYPWKGMNDQIFGLHFPEVIVLKAKTKTGKSLWTAFIEDFIIKNTDFKVADITVENTPEERARTLLSVHMKKPLHLKLAKVDIGVNNDDIFRAGREYFTDRRLVLFERDGMTDPRAILDKVRYFVTVLGCKVVIFDHINYLGAYHESDERKSIDEVSNKLADMAKDLRFCLIIVSHVNDEGKTFGSRNLGKAGYTIISLERDNHNPSEYVRNLTKVTIEDSRRYGSRIGRPIYLKYDEESYSLLEIDAEIAEEEINKIGDKELE